MEEMQVRSLGRADHLEKEWQPTPVFLPGKSHGQRSLAGCSPWGHKESDITTEQLKDNPGCAWVAGSKVSLFSLFAGETVISERFRRISLLWDRAHTL